MKSSWRVMILTVLVAAMGLSVARPAGAIPPFFKQFEAKYIKPEGNDQEKAFAALAAAEETGKCLICHVKGKEKTERNAFGTELSKLLDKEADKENVEKIIESLDKVAAMKSDPNDEKSPSFGELIAQGKLPGGAAEVAKTEPADEPPPKPRPMPLPEARPADPQSVDEAVAGIEALGGTVRDIAMNDDSKEVDFHLSGTALGDHGLVYVKAIPKLIHLNLKDTQVTDEGLKELAGLTSLTKLHLEQSLITDAGLEHLKGLENLEYLNLYGTAVTDAGLESLKALPNLKKLYVWRTKVTDEGAAKLKEARSDLNIVK